MAVEPYTPVLSLRPATPPDRGAILSALALRDAHDTGDPGFSRDHFIDRWRAAGFDPERDAIVAEADGLVVGYGAVFHVGAFAFVVPAFEGRGIGTQLLQFTERRTRELGQDRYRQRIVRGNATAAALLRGSAYGEARIIWQMARALADVPRAPAPPAGITFAPLDPRADARALHAADTAAFSANADYDPETFEDFVAEHLAVGHLDREASVVARRGACIAGYAVCLHLEPAIGYIDLLAVAPAERERGLGRALLGHALAAFARQGFTEARLDVASDNPGALRLYERAGMSPRHGAAIWEKPL